MARGTMILPNGKKFYDEKVRNEAAERKYSDGFGFNNHKAYNRAQENQKTNRIVNEELNNL